VEELKQKTGETIGLLSGEAAHFEQQTTRGSKVSKPGS
jgi:hypothetical protein